MNTESPNGTNKTGLLLVMLAVAQIVPIGLALMVNFGGIQDQIVRALDRNPEPLGEAGALVVVSGATVAGFIAFLAAVVLAVLAPKVSRGSGTSSSARTGARVVGGLLFLWSAVVTVVNPMGGPLTLLAPAADTNNTLSGRQFQGQLNDALPGWIPPVLIGFTVLTAALVIAVYVSIARTRHAE